MERMTKWKTWILAGMLGAFFLAGCAALKESRPIILNKEYEKMIAGRLDADYVGTDNCLRACHFHDTRRRDFDLSTMGTQLSRESGMPIVNCESCHGPLATSAKRGAKALQIKSAIKKNAGGTMGSLKLNNGQIKAMPPMA